VNNKKKGMEIFIAAILAISVLAAMTPMASAAPKPKPSGSFQASSADIVVSNNIYDVTVEDTSGSDGIGTYTVSTGSGFPQPNQDILFSGADHDAWSSYLTVRSYTTKTDYVTTTSSPATTPGFTVINLDPANVNIVPTATSVTTSWSTGAVGTDALSITQVIAIEGTTVADSRVRVTTNVTNTGEESVRIGIRYEWDIMIDGADGSWFAERNPNGPWIDTEQEWALPIFESYETTNDPANPIFTIVGTVTGPATLSPPPTPPDLLQFAAWGSTPSPGVYDFAFNFTPTGRTIAGAGKDSAITYLWGNNETNAIELSPGETVSVTQYLYAIPAPAPAPVPAITPIGLIALVGLLSVITAVSIRTTVRKKRE